MVTFLSKNKKLYFYKLILKLLGNFFIKEYEIIFYKFKLVINILLINVKLYFYKLILKLIDNFSIKEYEIIFFINLF